MVIELEPFESLLALVPLHGTSDDPTEGLSACDWVSIK